jgi:hypothetical protein
MLSDSLNEKQIERLLSEGQIDYSFNTPSANFRLNTAFLDE